MKVFSIFFSIVFGTLCDTSQHWLTSKENEIRLGSCGEPMGETLWMATAYRNDRFRSGRNSELKIRRQKNQRIRPTVKPRTEPRNPTMELIAEMLAAKKMEVKNRTVSWKESTDWETDFVNSTETSWNGTETLNSTKTAMEMTTRRPTLDFEKISKLLQILPRVDPPVINKTNAVFVSQTHLLMSSTWFIEFGEDDHEWHWKHNKTQLDYSICRENETASYRTSPPSVFNHVMDFHRDWRNVEEIIFLRFCQYRDDSRGVLALIVVNRSSSPVPVLCLPKTIDKDQFLRMDYFEETSAVIVTETGDVRNLTIYQ
ncbi:hypothetical protein B9Z55_023706 [Caenorhabditis nigoni]|uniref:Uncharacterized protein n=2 Tax=Caenorhabditis nigoni TaxID=1611254 RepID=A0A2G5SRC0_9PELO|nr:hypothetical protein B9Z55_023706 [Caenorhabditis nigoni]